MLASSTNFAFGFFGWPLEGKFLQEVTIEATGVSLRSASGSNSHFVLSITTPSPHTLPAQTPMWPREDIEGHPLCSNGSPFTSKMP